MLYRHTQRAPMYLYVLAIAAGLVVAGTLVVRPLELRLILQAVALVVVLIAYCFQTLTVEDAGDRLQLRYGPLPFFRKTIPYAEIVSAEAGRTSVIDGWGIHYVLGRGWTYNLWGFGCVVLRLRRGVLRVGTDDPTGLAAFLQTKLNR